jgi:nucleoside triphosphatase
MAAQSFAEPIAGVLVLNPHNPGLLLKTHKWRGKYVVPGGHIELGESAIEAAKRETREETGPDVRDLRFLNWQECIYLDFVAHTGDSGVVLNEGAESFIWIDPARALSELEVDRYTAVSIRALVENGGEL